MIVASCRRPNSRARRGHPRGVYHPRPCSSSGIDVGGTFTDLTAVDEATGRVVVTKVPSRPRHEAARRAGRARRARHRRRGRPAAGPRHHRRAPTPCSSGAGARVAVLTTAGFRDLIEIGRTKRNIPALFVPTFVRPKPVVERKHRFEVDRAAGGRRRACWCRSIRPASSARSTRALAAGRRGDRGVPAPRLPEPGARARDRRRGQGPAARACPSPARPTSWPSTASSSASRRPCSTPTCSRSMDGYLDRRSRSACAPPATRTACSPSASSGGMMTTETARRLPIKTIFSGPGRRREPGVLRGRGRRRARLHHLRHGRHLDRRLPRARPRAADDLRRHGRRVPGQGAADRHAHGRRRRRLASPGSTWTAACRSGRAAPAPRRARPPTASAAPSPPSPTPTWCSGRIGDQRGAWAAASRIDAARGARARWRRWRARMGGRSAWRRWPRASSRIAVARMTSAIREISIQRGHDPRDFTLIAFGGAGPMHALALADEIGIPRVLVPRHPGNFSALGLLASDIKHDDVRTRVGPLARAARRRCAGAVRRDGGAARGASSSWRASPPAQQRLRRSLDLRYRGQAFELNISVARRDELRSPRSRPAFHRAAPGRVRPRRTRRPTIELVNARLTAYGVVRQAGGRRATERGARRSTSALVERRPVWFEGARARLPGVGARAAARAAPSSPGPPSWRSSARPPWCRRAGAARSTRTATCSFEREARHDRSHHARGHARGASSRSCARCASPSCAPRTRRSSTRARTSPACSWTATPRSWPCPRAQDHPLHIVPIGWSMKAVREKFGDDIHPGDIFLHNDPYTGGTHLNDVAMIYPLFAGRRGCSSSRSCARTGATWAA